MSTKPNVTDSIDKRLVVDSVSDLTLADRWINKEGDNIAYPGMVVGASDGLYYLTALPATSESSWKKVETEVDWKTVHRLTLDTDKGDIALVANQDLNSILAPGRYITTSSVTADTIINSPTSYAFQLEVIRPISFTSDYYLLQKVTTFLGHIWIRRVTELQGAYDSWRRVDQEGTILYSNTSGGTGTISLSSSASNYSRLLVFFTSYDGYATSIHIDSPDGKTFFNVSGYISDTVTAGNIKYGQWTISGSTITQKGCAQTSYSTTGTGGASSDNRFIKILKVIGY